MAKKSSIQLLLVNESDNHSEQLISSFRKAGRIARPYRIRSAEELLAALQDEHWDLLIADNKHPEVSFQQTLKQLQQLQLDLPAIVITDRQQEIQQALELGARDTIGNGQELPLTHAALREIDDLNTRRQLQHTSTALAEAERRAELLLSESSEAIAYITDGMIISCNDAFATRFGYDSPDELDCMTVIDLIANSDKGLFKNLLKAQANKQDTSTEYLINGISRQEEIFAATLELSNAMLDDEPCMQLSVYEQQANSNSDAASADPGDGSITNKHFLLKLASAFAQNQADNSETALLFIQIDQFHKLRDEHGLSATQLIQQQISQFILQQIHETDFLCHYCDDGFALLLNQHDSGQAEQFANELCQTIHQLPLDALSGQSCSATISVLAINGDSSDDPVRLMDNAFHGCINIRQQHSHGIGNRAELYTPPKERKILAKASDDSAMDDALAEAIDDKHFRLSFQPVISIRGSRSDHYEVRTRMDDADGREIAATDFVKSMQFEQANTRLDRWTILEATKQLGEQNNQQQKLQLLINLTDHALNDQSLLPWLKVALKAGNLSPNALIFQFQGQDLLDHLQAAQSFSKALQELGCLLAIDNFSGNDEHLKLLANINAHYVRIAQSITDELQHGNDHQVLKSLINSIHAEQAKAIIAGVDSASVMAQLWQLGVDFIEGNYLAPATHSMDYEFTDIA